MPGHPFVNPLVTAAQQHQLARLRKFSRQPLVKPAALRGKQNYPRAGSAQRQNRLDCLEKRLRLEHHALASAKRAIVYRPVTITSPVSQIVNTNFQSPRLPGFGDDAIIQRPRKEFREDRDNVKPHPSALVLGLQLNLFAWGCESALDLSRPIDNRPQVDNLPHMFLRSERHWDHNSNKPSGRSTSIVRRSRSTLRQIAGTNGISASRPLQSTSNRGGPPNRRQPRTNPSVSPLAPSRTAKPSKSLS